MDEVRTERGSKWYRIVAMLAVVMLGATTLTALSGCEATEGLGRDIEGTSERTQEVFD